ncbi:hypothetical protein [Spinactinospora alkalitolerans]|uniref:hypothetical protein n=1 Tax=Spinactinospora alkalitolerans TaxID=687207 RepID=UPI0015CA77BE|nr:hypothetical protein [Spinactinospora alkalitolerans]
MLPYTAYLRVYQPITAFSSRERAYWRAYADSPHRPRRVGAVAAEHEESLRRMVATPPVVAPGSESGDAYVRRAGSELFICPWQTRLRSWLAFREFRSATPAALSPAFVPDSVAEAAEGAFERWREQGERLRTQILTSTWTVPLPWFAPFDADERCLVLGTDTGQTAVRDEADSRSRHPAGGSPAQDDRLRPASIPEPTRTMLYVTEVAEARRRLARAVAVMRAALGEATALAATEQLDDWLAGVAHPRALLELDYGGLVRLLDDDDLREDQSVAEVAAAITGLETDQEELTLAMYQRLIRRWRAVQALEHAN